MKNDTRLPFSAIYVSAPLLCRCRYAMVAASLTLLRWWMYFDVGGGDGDGVGLEVVYH